MPISRVRCETEYRDHGVDPGDTEQQRHPAGDRQHDERERRPRHRRVVDLLQGASSSQRQIGVDRPDGPSQLVDESVRSRATAANQVGDAAIDEVAVLPDREEVRHQERPVRHGRRLLVEAIVAHVGDDADDFTPVALGIRAHALAEGCRRLPPQLAGETLRHHGDRPLLVEIGPREITAGDERSAHRVHVARGHELEQPYGRDLGIGVAAILRVNRIVPAVAGHRDRRRDRNRRHAGNGRHLVHDRLEHARDADFLLDLRFGNREPECLHFMRTHESRMNAGQLLERSNHESGADEQDERQRDLHDDERIACPMALPARAGRASAAAEHVGDARAGGT